MNHRRSWRVPVSRAAVALAAGWTLVTPASGADPPVVSRNPLSQRVSAGCTAFLIGGSSDPQAAFLWERDGLDSAGPPVRAFRHVLPMDRGTYRLIARRSEPGGNPPLMETLSAPARIDVLVAPQQPGAVDLDWRDAGIAQTVTSATADVRAIVPLPDGGCLIAGEFSEVGGTPAGNVCRLRSDGTPETAFMAARAGFDKKVRTVVRWGDRLVAGGDFSLFDGLAAPRLAAFFLQGQRDTAFVPPELASNVRALAVQTVGGEERLLVGLSGAPYLRRLERTGAVDVAFDAAVAQTGLNGRVNAIAIQADGRILIGGLFSVVPGQPCPFNRVGRLLATGAVDPSFQSGGTSGTDAEVATVAVQPTGRILLGGRFSAIAGQARFYLGRLLPDGSVDSTFSTTPNDIVSVLLPLPDGSVMMGGDFTRLAGESVRAVARLLPSGARDPAWTPQAFNGSVLALASDAVGKIWAGGAFRQPHECIVRLESQAHPGPPVLLAPPEDRELIEGGTEMLHVAVLAGSDAVFVWKKDGAVRAVTVEGELVLPSAGIADAGLYDCRVESPAGALEVGPFRVAVRPRAPGARPRSHAVTSQSVVIPNQGHAEAAFDLPSLEVDEVHVTVAIQHPDTNDLVLELVAPSGAPVRLFEPDIPVTIRRGRDFHHTVFADGAPRSITEAAAPYIGTFAPAGSTAGLSSLRGSQPAGRWRLVVQDLRLDSSTGTLTFAALDVFSPASPLPAEIWPLLPAGAASNSPRPAAGAIVTHWAAPRATLEAQASDDMAAWQRVSPGEWLSLRVWDDRTARSHFAAPQSRQRFWRLMRLP